MTPEEVHPAPGARPPAEPGPRRGARRRRWAVLGLLAVLLAGGGVAAYLLLRPRPPQAEPDDPWFEDVTERVGVDFVHDAGDLGTYLMSQINGSGVAVFDFDGDGRLDLYFLVHVGPDSKSTNRLYRNMPDGTFKDVTAGSGLGIGGLNTGVIVGDVNNDGRPDVVVTQVGGLRLFVNAGNGTFRDATAESGLTNLLWGTSANLFDSDRDGWLDLVVVNYVEFEPNRPCYDGSARREYCGPVIFPGTVTKLYRNRTGDPKAPPGTVRFEDVTVAAGLAAAPGPGLGVYCADFTGDGWPDIFVANDLKPNHLWVNQRNGTFVEEAVARGIARDAMGGAQSGMGVAAGDLNGDGLLDVYVTHLTGEYNTAWTQDPRRPGHFRDTTRQTGLLAAGWRGTGWGTTLADFDQDGWPDIAVVNGRVARGGTTPNPAVGEHFQSYTERNQLFRNEGGGKFRDVSERNRPFCGTPNMGRGLAYGDLDGDGSLDLVVSNIANPAQVFRNVARGRGHWLLVRAGDPRLNRDAYGAEVRVRAGDRRMLRVVNPGDSFQCSSDPRAHFGLGPAARHDGVHVVWPDGRAELFPAGDADRAVVLRRGEGTEKPLKDWVEGK